MRRPYRKVPVIILGVIFFAVAAGAQSSQPPASGQTAPAQQGGQAQMSSENLSPEAQAKLVEAIRHQLRMLPYDGVFDNMAFRLQGRTVILEGQVLRSSLKPDAEHAVAKIEGVEKVVNNIEVLPPGAMDQRIRLAVREAIYGYGPLFKYSNLPIPPIRIIVKNGNVTLEGVVNNETDKGLCSLRANQVESVLNVTNNLRVAPPDGKQKDKKSKSGGEA